MYNYSFDDENLLDKAQKEFNESVLNENMTDVERDKTLSKLAKLEEDAILNYDELLQCAIASDDSEMIALINEITDDERTHVGNIVQARLDLTPEQGEKIEDGFEEYDKMEEDILTAEEIDGIVDIFINDQERAESENEDFVVVENNGKQWKVLAKERGLNNAARAYNRTTKNITNETRLITLNELPELMRKNETKRRNEAPLNAKSLFVALTSELNPLYKCEITSDDTMKCTDDEGNFIEVSFLEDTDPIELNMQVTFNDDTTTEVVSYAYDNIQSTADFISAVIIGEVAAYNEDEFEENSEEVEDIGQIVDIEDADKQIAEDTIQEEIDKTEEPSEEIETEEVEEKVEKTESKQNEMCMMKLPTQNDEQEKIEEIQCVSGKCNDEKCKNEDGGTVADLGTAPILPAGSEIFPLEDDIDELQEVNEAYELQGIKKEFDYAIEQAREHFKKGDDINASDWLENSENIVKDITNKSVKDDCQARIDNLKEEFKTKLQKPVKEASELHQVVSNIIKADNTKESPADKLNKEFDAKATINNGSSVYGFKPLNVTIPMIDQDIMNNAIIAASTAMTDPRPEVLLSIKESFKNIDMKTIEDLVDKQDIGKIVHYLYESSINKNEDTFTNPQMNQVNNNITNNTSTNTASTNTNVSGNDPETPKLADDINPAPTEVQGFPKDKSEIENTSNIQVSNNPITKDAGTEDIPTK